MNQCAIQQNRVDRSPDEMRSSFAAVGSTMFMPDHHHHHHHRWDAVVCTKPRRTGLPINCPSGSFSYHMSHQADHNTSASKAGSELLDIILPMGGHDNDRYYTNTTNSTQVASSPSPFFYGSPPIRVSNPLIQDVRFKDPLPPTSSAHLFPREESRVCFGNKPAVRVEGFDCLDRDRSRNCSIPALA